MSMSMGKRDLVMSLSHSPSRLPSPPRGLGFRGTAQRPDSFSDADFRHTDLVNLRSDAGGNAFLNQYAVVKDLEQGAFGKVKLCLNTTTNCLCALKCVNRKLLRRKYAARGRDKGQQAIKKEIAIMKKLVHENVVRLHEVIDDEVGQYIFMVLEYVPGGPIYDSAEFQHAGMGEELAQHYFRETCRGLDFLHINNVIHRDLKPDNLLKMTDGTVKIVDFGVSELFNDEDGNSPEVTSAVGTPAFLAPEIAMGGKARGKPSDIWSLGVTLFFIVCGRLPFSGKTVNGVITAITNNDVVVPDTMSQALRHLLHGILDKNPETRMTLEQIMVHEWVTGDGNKPLPVSNAVALVTEKEVSDSISYSEVWGFFFKAATLCIYQPGEYVIREGELGNDIFYIESGEVEVETLKKQHIKTSTSGANVTSDDEGNASTLDTLDEILSRPILIKGDKVLNRRRSVSYDERQDELEKNASGATAETCQTSGGVSEEGKQRYGRSNKKDAKSGSCGGSGTVNFFSCCFGGGRDTEDFGQLSSTNDVISKRGAGEFIGDMTLLSSVDRPSKHPASVRAIGLTRCLRISANTLIKTLQEKPTMLEEVRLSVIRQDSELLMGQMQLRVGSFNGLPECNRHRSLGSAFQGRVAQSRLSFSVNSTVWETI